MNLDKIQSILSPLGYTLDQEQPHMSGERFLMMRNKYVLSGKDTSDNKIIIKISNDPEGRKDIEREKRARDLLNSLVFSNKLILFPKEIYFGEKDGYMIWIIEFIAQERVFVSYDLEDQFFLILRALEEQEAFHATTFEHLKTVDKLFPVLHAREY